MPPDFWKPHSPDLALALALRWLCSWFPTGARGAGAPPWPEGSTSVHCHPFRDFADTGRVRAAGGLARKHVPQEDWLWAARKSTLCPRLGQAGGAHGATQGEATGMGEKGLSPEAPLLGTKQVRTHRGYWTGHVGPLKRLPGPKRS